MQTLVATVPDVYGRRVRSDLVDGLLRSDEPSVRWKVRVGVLGEGPDDAEIRRLRDQIRRSARVAALLNGHAATRPQCYAKWQGSHWVLLALGELGHPGGPEITPLVDDVLATWLHPRYQEEVTTVRRRAAGVPVIGGRHRRCASQQGAALLSLVRLGIVDDRVGRLAELLRRWQWPDGGWNCDLRPEAASASVHETLLPMRGLAAYAAATHDRDAALTARSAAQVLLSRRLLYRRSTGELIDPDWVRLRYPSYWHYDLLAGLTGLTEVGLITDSRCRPALDLLIEQELPAGGWPAQARYYAGAGRPRAGSDHVNWGGVSTRRANPWVTAAALTVLAAAGH